MHALATKTGSVPLYVLPEQAAAHPRPPRVLVAEDDDAMRDLLVEELERRGFEVYAGRNALEVLAMFARLDNGDPRLGEVDVIVTDVRMPGMSGLELLAEIRAAARWTPIIVVTGFGSLELHDEAYALGADAVFDKPCDLSALVAMAADLSEWRRA